MNKKKILILQNELSAYNVPVYNEITDSHYDSTVVIPKPKCLEKMLEIATVLAKPFPQVESRCI